MFTQFNNEVPVTCWRDSALGIHFTAECNPAV